PPGYELIVTKDAMVEGVHFLGSEEPSLIARKLLRTNLSDLAGTGATPLCYFVAGMIKKPIDIQWIKSFAEGLGEDQKRYQIHLAGGDPTSTSGPNSFSLTAMGLLKSGTALKRSGAKIGDDIYVSGTLGDSALGLLSLQGKIPADEFLHM